MPNRTLAWRQVAILLASSHDELPAALGYPPPSRDVQAWARSALDRVDNFWESDDVDGVIGARMERDLEALAGRPLVDALEAIVALLYLPTDRGLRAWYDVLWGLRRRHPQPPHVPVPDTLRDRLAAIVASGNERRVRVRTRTPVEIDEWERAFQLKHGAALGAETIAYDVLDLRATDWILQAVADALQPVEYQALEDWANAELSSYEPNPRPSTRPAVQRLRFPRAT